MATWTRLHQRLGMEPQVLTYGHVAAAVTQNLREDAHLDWKAVRNTSEHGKDELAKDVAAMANSGGGIIVFGVAEEGPDKRLVHHDIPLTDGNEDQTRQVVWARVRPLVSGIELLSIENPDNPGRGAFAVVVPDSQQAPHFVESASKPSAAPFRNGPTTEYMRERDIEAAFRTRFNREVDIEARLDRIHQAVRSRLDFSGRMPATEYWSVIALVPAAPRPFVATRPTKSEGEIAWRNAAARERSLPVAGARFPGGVGQVGVSLRRGLRRWVHEDMGGDGVSLVDLFLAELHDDGAVALALPVGARTESGNDCHLVDATRVERASIAAVALTRVWADHLGISGDLIARAKLLLDESNSEPVGIWGQESYGGLQYASRPAWTRSVSRFETVEAAMPSPPSTDGDRECAIDLTEGIVHQFGYNRLEYLR